MKLSRNSYGLKRKLAEWWFCRIIAVGWSASMLSGGDAGAAQVNWGSDRLATNLTSEGAGSEMDDSFTFELGAFDPGFVPTEANRGEWIERWNTASVAAYSGSFHFFAGTAPVDSSNPAFSASNRGYIWGYNSRVAGQPAEWILITNPAWMWPAGSGTATPVEWCVAEASVAVLGQINAADGSYHMRSAGLTPGLDANDPGVWRVVSFGDEASDESVAGWSADPDCDGIPNLLEFALGSEALGANGSGGIALGAEVIGGTTYQTLSVARVRRASIAYIPEVSSDLATWTSGADAVEVVEDSENRLTVRDRMPRTENRRFIRLSVAFRAED